MLLPPLCKILVFKLMYVKKHVSGLYNVAISHHHCLI
jgi:hypothetical protein